MARHNPKLAKVNRSYSLDEVARLFGAHRNTVRGWCRAGLATIDDHRPMMVQGRVLRAFLEGRRARAKRPCAPGELYCCKCREACAPAPGSVVFEASVAGAGSLRALCGVCETRMFRRARQSRLPAIMPATPVLIVRAAPHIEERPFPSLICAEG